LIEKESCLSKEINYKEEKMKELKEEFDRIIKLNKDLESDLSKF
jgi:chromosome segregation ATPase